ncbi:MAG: glycoside hydrolase family 88 protein [Cyclobacteriaceae bacterium]
MSLRFILIGATLGCTDDAPEANQSDFREIVSVLRKVCDYQLAHPVARVDGPKKMWERAVFYLGVMSTYQSTNDKRYLNAIWEWSQNQQFLIGPRKLHGDDQVLGQVYLALFDELKQLEMIRDIQVSFDSSMVHNWQGKKIWNWCDGLFMAPPALAHLAQITQNDKYINYMDSLWWDAYDLLYDTEEHLFYRDSRFKDTLNINGQKIFWSRGNGWVLAGIARMLTYLPPTAPGYSEYIRVFREMAQVIAARQRADGLWSSGLLDTEEFPEPETSGTAFFTYAFAWGINNGFLEKDIFMPIVEKAWNGLVQNVSQYGKLGSVQQPWDRPGPVYKDGHQEYGTGAFLLAGNELLTLYQK